jgi:hypothetical protein
MEEPDDDGALLKVAQAISDGHPVDWESESSAQKASRPELSHLKEMAAVAEAHRRARPTRPPAFDDTLSLRRSPVLRAGSFLRAALWGAALLIALLALRKLLA